MKTVQVAFLLAALIGCRSSHPVRIAVGGQGQLVYLPTTLAQQLGYYQSEGLQVTIEDLSGGAKALQALLGGSADVVSGFYDHTIQMAAGGRQIRAFVTMLRYPGLVAAVSPATSRNIQRIEDLKGSVVGVTAPGSSTHFWMNYLLVQHGLSPTEISATGIGSSAAAVAAMLRGMVDAAVMTDPALSQLIKQRPDVRILADTRTARGVKDVFGTESYPASVLYSTAGWIERNPDTARRLARAIVLTLQWIQDHSLQQVLEKVPESLRGEDGAVYLHALQNSLAMFSPDGRMTDEGAEAVRKVVALSIEQVRTAQVELSKTYTNEFVAR